MNNDAKHSLEAEEPNKKDGASIPDSVLSMSVKVSLDFQAVNL